MSNNQDDDAPVGENLVEEPDPAECKGRGRPKKNVHRPARTTTQVQYYMVNAIFAQEVAVLTSVKEAMGIANSDECKRR